MIIKNISGETQSGIDTGMYSIGQIDVAPDSVIQVADDVGNYLIQAFPHAFVPALAIGNSGAELEEDVTSMFNVGAINEGENVPEGTTFTEFVKQMLLDVFYPTYVNPSFSLSANQSNGQEIGKTIDITLTYNFNRGRINGVMSGSVRDPSAFQNYRAGAATKYTIDGVDKGLVNSHTIVGHVLSASQTFSGNVEYAQGPQPLDSDGNNYQVPYPAGDETRSRTITAIYPYFWGKVSGGSKPVKNQALINGGNKVVNGSNGTIVIDFNSADTDWLWFAIPASSASKNSWYIDALNNGPIGGISNLFDTEDLLNIDSPSAFWNGVEYKIYVSNYQSEVSNPMELRNS